MTKVYQSPHTNAVQKVDASVAVWSFLFGGFYFAYKEMWKWVFIYFAVMVVSMTIPFLPWIVAAIFAVMAPNLVEDHFKEKGWKLKDGV